MISIEKNGQILNLEDYAVRSGKKELVLENLTKEELINIKISSNVNYESEILNDGKDAEISFKEGNQFFKLTLKGIDEILGQNNAIELINIEKVALDESLTEKEFQISELTTIDVPSTGRFVYSQVDNGFTSSSSFSNFGASYNEAKSSVIDGYHEGTHLGQHIIYGLLGWIINDQPEIDNVRIDTFESELSTSFTNETLTIDTTSEYALSNYVHDHNKNDTHTFSRCGDSIGVCVKTTNQTLLSAIENEDLDYIKSVLIKVASIPEIIVAMNNDIDGIPSPDIDAQTIINEIMTAQDLESAVECVNEAFDYLGIVVQLSPTGLSVTLNDAKALEKDNLINVTVNEDGSYEVTSPLFDHLGINDYMSVKFDYIADDNSNALLGRSISDPATVTVNIQGTNDKPIVSEVAVNLIESDISTLVIDANDSNALGNYVSDDDIFDIHTFARSGTTLGFSVSTTNADILTAIVNEDLTYIKNALDKIASIPEVIVALTNDVDAIPTIAVQTAISEIMAATDLATIEAIATNAFAQLGINVSIDPVTGITLTMADASVLETEGLLTVTVNADGSYEISSPLFDTLGTNDEMNITFDYVADDGTNDANGESNISDPATVTVNISGVNDAPVITTAAVVNYLETDFLDNTNAGIENYYKVLSAADVFAQLGIEDPDSVNIGLSLSNNSSSFEVNGTDITSGTTNGVFQLDQTTYDSNPGWAAMGASVGDFVIYSQEIDGLGTNDDMVASFKVRAYDGEDYSAESTVTVNISGVNDAPVITTAAVVNYLETDFLDNANAGIENYYKVLSAADVFAQLGIEDPDSVNIGLSLSNNSSSFEVNGTDITSGTTNGVFQLDQATYDSNPGWATMGASVGDFVIYSQEIDGLGTNDDMVASFKVRAYDGEDYSAESTVTVNISGVNDAPVITTAAVVNYLETDFLDNANAGIENYYKVLSAADVFAQLGIEDPDSVNIGLSLSNNSSSFEVNGTDITSGTTNGVFQLDQTTYDSNPGWAAMGASVGDFVIYSQEIDGLGTNDDMVASFKVRAYDGEDYSAESTVTVNISGVNDAPVITTAAVVNYLETDFLDNTNAGIENYYKVLSAADVFAQLGIEDPDSVNIGLSLSNNSSSFEVNGTDITTPNTNGVFQLDQTTYDSNPGWAAMGASVGDFVIYSQEIDGLGTNDDMVASFKVRAYDGEDYSAESTVTVNISGVNDAPEVSLVEESTLLGTGLSLSDLDTITASGTDSVGETAFRVYESTTVTITTNGPTTDPVLYVFDEAGNVVATDDDSGTAAGSWYNATVTLTLAPGDYVVKFSDYPYGGTETNTNDRTGDITLSFTADKDISVYESEINTKLTVGADVDDAEVDMSALLQEASQGNTIDSLDEVDLTTGDHILSNMDVTELLSITDGDNTLKIDGDTGDKIDLDTNIWSQPVGNETENIDSTVYNRYEATDSVTGHTLTLLIEQDVTVI